MRRTRRHLVGGAAVLVAVAVGTSGCSSDADAGGPSGPAGVATVDITVEDGTVSPSGEDVAVAPGQEVDLVVTADAPGEIHVHSDPETEFAYEGTGEPETFTLSIDRPGQVEVESHSLDQLIVKLVVS